MTADDNNKKTRTRTFYLYDPGFKGQHKRVEYIYEEPNWVIDKAEESEFTDIIPGYFEALTFFLREQI